MEEEWKDIEGYEGRFQVSNMGRIRRLYKKTKQIMTPRNSGKYYYTRLTGFDGKRKRFFIHRLVSIHFIPNPKNKQLVHHIDKNLLNNEVTNLKWKKDITKKQYDNIDESNEVWKELDKYDGIYQISNMGRVRNVPKNYILKYRINREGYCNIDLKKNQKTKSYGVHRLVALYFVSNIENKELVLHIDGNRINNVYTNLKWIDRHERGKILKQKRDALKPKKINIKDTMPDEWSTVEGYENYEISDCGNIINRKGHLLKPQIVNCYFAVGLTNKSGRKTLKIHRLVAKHFVNNPKPNKYNVVDHIDNNKLNNEVSNLRWTTHSGNSLSHTKNYRRYTYRKINQYDEDMNLIKIWSSMKEILETTKYKKAPIAMCLTNKRVRAYKHKWQYTDYKIEKVELKNDEIFKNIGIINGKDFSNYEISNYGNVRNVIHGNYLKPCKSTVYDIITIYNRIEKKKCSHLVHRLVAILFVDGRTSKKNIVNHIDEYKRNNYYKNLEWTTLGKNNEYSFAKKVYQIDSKTNEVINIFNSASDACINLGYSKKIKFKISSCCRGERSFVFGYKWKYVKKLV